MLLLIGIAIIINSCGDNNIDPPYVPPINNNNDTVSVDEFAWTAGMTQRPLDTIGRQLVTGNVYNYNFRMYLGNSQCNPNPLYLYSFGIPHVNSQGQTVYPNSSNEAQYNITSISGGWVYFTIRCEAGHLLKFNVAKFYNGQWIWFLRYGLYPDDNENNIYSFYTY